MLISCKRALHQPGNFAVKLAEFKGAADHQAAAAPFDSAGRFKIKVQQLGYFGPAIRLSRQTLAQRLIAQGGITREYLQEQATFIVK